MAAGAGRTAAGAAALPRWAHCLQGEARLRGACSGSVRQRSTSASAGALGRSSAGLTKHGAGPRMGPRPLPHHYKSSSVPQAKMIVDPSTTLMAKDNNGYDEHGEPMQAPPSYDAAVGSGDGHGQYLPGGAVKAQDVKVPPPSDPYSAGQPPPPHTAQMPATVVYNYVNPHNGERIVSLLPPDHPQMVCLQQGGHVPRSRFGFLGILAAVFWFPLGVGLCLLDRKVHCERCGVMLDEGIC